MKVEQCACGIAIGDTVTWKWLNQTQTGIVTAIIPERRAVYIDGDVLGWVCKCDGWANAPDRSITVEKKRTQLELFEI